MFKNILFTVLMLSLFACGGEEKDKINTQQTVKRQLLGGWTQADITPEVKKALNFVLMQMNTAAKLDKIVEVKTQIVQGKNFDITFELDNRELWRCIVYRDLNGKLFISKVATKLK